jgi:hypothetical protein
MARERRRGIRAHLRRELPAVVISMIALFVLFANTGLAAQVPSLARRALNADHAKVANTAKKANNALKLNGATASQIAALPGPGTDAQTLNGLSAAQIAGLPGPTGSLASSLFTYRQDSFELSKEGARSRVTAKCQAGEKAIAGGWEFTDGAAYVLNDQPEPDGSGWKFLIWGESGNNLAAVGYVWAVCAKVS